MPDSGARADHPPVGPLRRWLRGGLPILLVAVLGVVVALTVRGAAPWSSAGAGTDPGADVDLAVVPTSSGGSGATPTASVTSPAPDTASPDTSSPETSSPGTTSPEAASPETASPETSVPAAYDVRPGQAFTLKPAIAAARELLASPTDFRISTFNALGNSHTAPGGDQPGRAGGVTRMGYAWQLLGGADIDVIGFQEFQTPQVNAFRSLTSGAFEVYPGTAQGGQNAENSLAWRASAWQAVETHTIAIPYFGGHPREMPYVLLRHVATGQEVWFVNVHNPADKFGAAGRWRAIATARERELVNQLGADGTPVLLTGDLNDRQPAFCALTQGTTLHAADGGSSVGGCAPPAQPAVDWIFGTSPVQFSSYTRVSTGLINQTTDHPFVWAEVHIEPTSAATVP